MHRYDYIIVGVDVGYDSSKDWYADFEDEICGAPNRLFDVLPDFVCGKYCIAGKILASSNYHEGFDLTILRPDDVDRYMLAIKLSHNFGREIEPEEIQLFVISQFA